ncbi:MAG: glycosyltransferase family 1 protein [Novosphingobium sp.]|nr:glycosyltransferase family 1 protein [Novosphingobium sp.]
MTVILDISRLISRLRYSTPSGVDRVEMAYARGLLARYGPDGENTLAFAAVHPTGRYGRVPHKAALAYLDELERRWANEADAPRQRALASVLPRLAALLPTGRGVGSGKGAVYVQASPHHLTNAAKVHRILVRERARFLCLVHDLIPIEFPEYARPSGAALHRRRMETVASACATSGGAAVVNSAATGRALQPWLAPGTPIHVALLGTETLPPVAAEPSERPYFVCLGTIEPRKNHLILLNLWRHLAATLPQERIPRLIVIGRRGWENEQVFDMLERCPALVGHVEELGGCPDVRLSALLRGARALVMPSFAEGYGMPVAEALSVGTPVICSDLPALREVGGAAPDYLDPLDGPGWKAAVLDHAEGGPLHADQMARLPRWHNPSWSEHMAIVAGAIACLQGQRAWAGRRGIGRSAAG